MIEELYTYFLQSNGISTDTRNIIHDSIFFALKGANFDGNLFAIDALNQGAKFAVVDNEEIAKIHAKLFFVPDVLKALQDLALHHRLQFDIPVIGITGSNGKTTTKELIAIVLEQKYKILYTKGNLNNHIGVPLTLLQLNSTHEIAVIEMGANKFKDIEELCDIALPTHGIITNIGKAHLEGFIDFEGVLKTKKELYDSVAKRKGVLFLNNDDKILSDIIPPTRIITYGKHNSTVTGKLLDLNPFVEFEFTFDSETSGKIATKLIGEYNFYNFLASIAIGTYFNVSKRQIIEGLTNYQPTNNRSQVSKTNKNTLIIDCYNANPTSMAAALYSFAKIKSVNKIAFLGAMKELGRDSLQEHQKIVDLAKSLNIDTVLIGPEFTNTVHDFKLFHSTDELINTGISTENHLILLKGSRSIGLENLINLL